MIKNMPSWFPKMLGLPGRLSSGFRRIVCKGRHKPLGVCADSNFRSSRRGIEIAVLNGDSFLLSPSDFLVFGREGSVFAVFLPSEGPFLGSRVKFVCVKFFHKMELFYPSRWQEITNIPFSCLVLFLKYLESLESIFRLLSAWILHYKNSYMDLCWRI